MIFQNSGTATGKFMRRTSNGFKFIAVEGNGAFMLNEQTNNCCLCIQNPKLVPLKWSPAGEILLYPSPCDNLLFDLTNLSSLDSSIGFGRTYPKNSDLSFGWHIAIFEQLEPELSGTSEKNGTLFSPPNYLKFVLLLSIASLSSVDILKILCLYLALNWPRKSAPVLIHVWG